MAIAALHKVSRFVVLVLVVAGFSQQQAFADSKTVALPVLQNKTIAPRILYVENPRFPKLRADELSVIVNTAAGLVKDHFGITLKSPSTIQTLPIDTTFSDLLPQAPEGFKDLIGDFRAGTVDWATVREMLVEQISSYGALEDQIAFAAPFLMNDEQIRFLRMGKDYTREQALRYAGVLLAHELGHQVLHLGHPWSNTACLMRPAEVLDFAAWDKNLDPEKCPLGSDPEMTAGVLNIPVW